MSNASSEPEARIQQQAKRLQQVETEMQKVVVGQQRLVRHLLIALSTSGHVLIEGAPGLAKSLTVSSLAQALRLDFRRIQFTPDLLPGDLVGTLVYNQQEGDFQVRKGPLFTNLVLADEINRAPAKVQSALLEAMQERQVSLGETSHRLPNPFMVLATQNPLEQEGTYPLPEAQLDRFMFKVLVDYPSRKEELEIVRRMARTQPSLKLNGVLGAEDLAAVRDTVDEVHLAPRLEEYLVDLVRATRKPPKLKDLDLGAYLAVGASPRAAIALDLAAKAEALLSGRAHVLPEDIKAIAPAVLNHRIILNYAAERDGLTPTQLVEHLLAHIPLR